MCCNRPADTSRGDGGEWTGEGSEMFVTQYKEVGAHILDLSEIDYSHF